MNGCIYRTKDGECDLYAEGGKYRAFCVGDEPCEGRKRSNADRIRTMTDEELATWGATKIPCCPPGADLKELCFPKYHDCGGNPDLAMRCWLTWLKQEAQDD